MSYIGNSPTNIAFQTDTFSGTGSTTAITMSVAPANTTSVLVAVTGVLQDPSTYSVSGTTLTFSAAPPSGTSNISVRYLGIPASGVTTTAYRTVTNTTATAGQTSFTIPSYTVGYIDVFRNGVYLPTTDYTATTGTTVVLTNAATVGDTITTSSFFVSSVLNALPTTGGTLSGNLVVSGTETVSTITSPAATALTLQTNNGTTAITVDTSQNVGIGTSSPTALRTKNLEVSSSGTNDSAAIIANKRGTGYATMRLATVGGASGFDINFNFPNTGDLGFYDLAAAANRMIIDSSGQLLLGASSFTSNAANFTSGSMYANGNIFVNNSSGTAGYNVRLDGFSNNFYVVWNNGAGTDNNSIYYAYGGTAWVNSSDETLKDIIEPITDAANKVSTLRAVIGKLKTEEEGTRHAYLIAQDVQKVLPEAVYTNKSRVEGEPDTLGVGYTDVIPLLVAAIKEQQALINQLQADVAALKGKA